jgi:hypothetical protein
MSRIAIIIAGALAAGSLAGPALAQTPYPYPYPYPYPQQGYGAPQQGYPQQGYGQPYNYNQGGTVGAIINQLLGNRYTPNDRTAVSQCATAAIQQAAPQYRPNANGYGYQGYGYNQGYAQPYSNARVTAITEVRRRQNGLRVRGLLNSGMYGGGYSPYGNNPAYANAQSDLSFRCDVDYRGVVTNVRVGRNSAYRRPY